MVELFEARKPKEIDQQYEWSAHEPAGRRQGLKQSVIDVVTYGTRIAGLSDKDATLMTFGRTLYREHRVSRCGLRWSVTSGVSIRCSS